MLLTLKSYNDLRQRRPCQCHKLQQLFVILFFIATLMQCVSAQYEGDACETKNGNGVCTLQSKCPELEQLLKSRKLKPSDIVTCGLAVYEEIVCCPTTADRGGETTTRNPITTTTIITTTTKAIATTEPKRDFWLDLLNTTTTTTTTTTTSTAKPDFWLSLLTTSTTPRPLVIAGKEVDTDFEFIDLSSLVSNSKEQKKNEKLVNENVKRQNRQQPQQKLSPSNPAVFNGFFPNSQQINTMWQSPSNFPVNTPNTRPNVPNIAQPINFNGVVNVQMPHQRQLNQGNIMLQQPFTPNQNNIFGPNQLTNNRPPNNMPPNLNAPVNVQMPHTQINNWHNRRPNSFHIGHQPNFPAAQPWQWMNNNQLNEPHPFGPQQPTINQPQQQQPLPNHSIWPNQIPRPPTAPAMDPITMVNNNLQNAGFEIIKAVPQTQTEFAVDLQDSMETSTSTMRPSTTTTVDAFAPFQFRPSSDEIENENDKISDDNANGVGNTKPVENRPIWFGNNESSKPTTMNPNTVTANNRIGERPAVKACREIEAGLTPSLTPHILGGIPAELGEFPHMAAIGYTTIGNDEGPYEFRCGGTLIHKRFVLTAAHCVNSRDSLPAIVRLGVTNFSDPEQMRNRVEVKIQKVHIYPEYSSGSKYHDIALLELQSDVPFNENVQPTCLETDLRDPSELARLYVTGFGTINIRTRQQSNILLKARLNIVPLDRCNDSFIEVGLNRQIRDGIQETQLCAHDVEQVRDACQGDSGGPLSLLLDEAKLQYRLVGIISAGISCGTATPGLYTRVAAYLDYIESIVWAQTSVKG